MIGLHGAFSGELLAFARERQRQLQAEAERERLARQARVMEPRKLFAWLNLPGWGRSAEVAGCYPAVQPACC